MDRINLILIIISVFLSQITINFAQNVAYLTNGKNNHFTRLNDEVLNESITINYYPISTGDFWEYIVKDTTTFFGQFYEGMNFSMTKEVLDDTLMPNGKIYKKIKWENIANSVSYSPWFEYHRIDSTGNVFLFYNNQDYILFDFNLTIGQTYSSHVPNHIWKISDKYNIIGFGDTVQAIDYELLENGTLLKERYTVAEKFGIIYYQKNIREYAVPEGNFWGAVINGKVYGIMIAKKQTIDWSEFYPLHVGDYWVFEGYNNGVFTTSTERIIGDTLMPDSNIYFIFCSIDHNYHDTVFNYKSLDSLGRIKTWEWWNSTSTTHIKLNFIVGDTTSSPFSNYQVWRNNNKYISSITGEVELFFYTYPDLTFEAEYYTRNIGLSQWSSEHNFRYIKGVYVDGTLVWGDTILTNIDDHLNPEITNYALFQNYPNPFNSSTIISFYIPKSTTVKLVVYNLLGENIETLIDNYMSVGKYKVKFEKKNITSGIYIFRLTTDEIKLNNKMIYLK